MANVYSRKAHLEQKNNQRKAIGYALLTFVVVAVLLIYGIPLFVKVSGFLYDLRKSTEPIGAQDSTPPPPPRLDSVPQATNKTVVDITGHTETGLIVTITVNGKKEEVLSDSGGKFLYTAKLNDGENNISATAKDSAGNVSQKSEIINILFDNKAPDLEISKPSDGKEFYGSNQRQVEIAGVSEKETRIQINDRLAIVDSNGKFSLVFSLNEGDNKFTIKAEDLAGNLTEKSVSVKFFP